MYNESFGNFLSVEFSNNNNDKKQKTKKTLELVFYVSLDFIPFCN